MLNTSVDTVVVIVNWQRPSDTISCVRSVLETRGPTPVILVVDNGSQDNSVNEINQACPQVVMVRLPKNLGFTGGYNAGIEWSLNIGAQNILLLNNDTIVYPQTLPALLAAPWDVSVPKILNYDDHNKIWAAGCRWRSFPPSVLMIGFGKPDGPEYDRPGPLGFATGCALLCKRRIFETVGGFDPVFESYMEDYDFSYRLIAAGFKMGYVPEARLLHRGSMTLGNTSRSFWRLLGRNTVLFYRKGQRYSKRDLATHLIYISLRETFKGHYSLMSPFWQGIQEGFTLLQSKELK